MLTESKIEKNYQKLLATNEKHQFLSEEFISKYGNEIKVGLSTETNYTFAGGAILFALKVTKYAIMVNGLLPKNKQFDEGEIIRMSIMSNLRLGTEVEGTYKEEIDADNLYRFVSTGCKLNESEFKFMYAEFLTDTFALGRLIKEAKSLANLEIILPEGE
jgi:hypothetical protein